MRFQDPFDDEGFILDFDDPLTPWLALAALLLAWLLICPMASSQEHSKSPYVGAYVYYSGSPVARYGHDGKYLLPDHRVTPGAINPEIVADPSGDHRLVNGIEVNICAKGFNTKPFRKATKDESIKKRVCEKYGVKSGCPGPGYELDDLVPVEVGAANVESNLWPQPIAQAHIKDRLEDQLKPLVCHRKMTLKQAQDCIRENWVTCAAKVKVLEAK